jgi:hypothetical protein
VLLTRLREGQRATVLQMPAAGAAARAPESANSATTTADVRDRTVELAFGELTSLAE